MSQGMDHGGAHDLIGWIAALVLVIGGAIFLVLAARERFGQERRTGPAAADGDGPRTSVAPEAARRAAVGMIVSLSLGAAVIHFAAAPHHYTELGDLGAGFIAAGAFQAAWARAANGTITRRTAWIGIAVNLGIIVAWIVSRSVGLPVGPEPWTPEVVGLPDGASTVFELLIVTGLAIRLLGVDRVRLVRSGPVRSIAAIAVVPVVGLVLLTTSLSTLAIVAGADHGPSHVSPIAGAEHATAGH